MVSWKRTQDSEEKQHAHNLVGISGIFERLYYVFWFVGYLTLIIICVSYLHYLLSTLYSFLVNKQKDFCARNPNGYPFQKWCALSALLDESSNLPRIFFETTYSFIFLEWNRSIKSLRFYILQFNVHTRKW